MYVKHNQSASQFKFNANFWLKLIFNFFHENYNEANFGFVAHVLHLDYSFIYSKIRRKQGKVDLIDKC